VKPGSAISRVQQAVDTRTRANPPNGRPRPPRQNRHPAPACFSAAPNPLSALPRQNVVSPGLQRPRTLRFFASRPAGHPPCLKPRSISPTSGPGKRPSPRRPLFTQIAALVVAATTSVYSDSVPFVGLAGRSRETHSGSGSDGGPGPETPGPSPRPPRPPFEGAKPPLRLPIKGMS